MKMSKLFVQTLREFPNDAEAISHKLLVRAGFIKKLAKSLGKEFVDLDDEITKTTGKTPSEIITKSGELEFRKIENQTLKAVLLKTGTVIALGGGAIVSEENRRLLSLNSVTIYIKRDLALLESKGRPLSQKLGVKKLFEERKSLYETADIWVDNNGDIETSVKESIKEYETTRSKWT